jgi:hypothetical protein
MPQYAKANHGSNRKRGGNLRPRQQHGQHGHQHQSGTAPATALMEKARIESRNRNPMSILGLDTPLSDGKRKELTCQ